MEKECEICGKKRGIKDISNSELRRLTTTGGFFKPLYFICTECKEKLSLKKGC